MLDDTDTVVLQPKNPQAFVNAWNKEIAYALKREKNFRKYAKESVQLYEAKNPESVPFNILYSNTETLIPAVYNSLPIPIVQRKFKDADPVGKSVSEVSTRTLKFLLDVQDEDYDCFDDLAQAAVLDAVVTNRGLMRFRYVAHEEYEDECVYGESVRYDKFFHGFARTWRKVPWIGFEWDMSREELKSNFPKIKLTDLRGVTDNLDEDYSDNKIEDRDELAGVKTYKVYEIWDKETKKVFFISPVSPDAPLRYIDDPLGLTAFFPVPKPLNFMKKITTLVPTPLYQQYRQQHAELNELTRRLKAIVKAIRFRGAYNAAVEGIEKILSAEDNEFVPVENVQTMPDGTGMDKLLWTVPVQELAVTAQQLYQQREQCKQAIYEITGISDILRGATAASETATAQTIKNQWGTLRLKRMQREVQRYCRDCCVIMAEIAARKFELQTFQKLTGLPYLTNAQKAQADQMIQQYQAMAQAAQQQGQQPPPPPNIPQSLQIAYVSPTWEQIMQVMRDRLIFNYKIDIETNSTIDAEASQDKEDIAELMNAMSQFLNGIAPLVEQGVMPIEVAKSMLLMVARRYNFGSQMEDAINMMQPPQPQTDPNAAVKQQAESAKAQTETLKAQHDQEELNQKMQLSKQEFEQKAQLMAMEYNAKIADAQAKRDAAALQSQNLTQKAFQSAQEHQQRMEMMKQQQSVADSETD